MGSIDWRQNIIRDGMEQDGYIAERDGLHGSLSFKYRPAMGEVVEKTILEMSGIGQGDKYWLRMCDIIVTYAKSWDVEEELTKDNVRLLRPQLALAMYQIIFNQKPSDPVPDDKNPKTHLVEDQVKKS